MERLAFKMRCREIACLETKLFGNPISNVGAMQILYEREDMPWTLTLTHPPPRAYPNIGDMQFDPLEGPEKP